jgi:hypothetical protein
MGDLYPHLTPEELAEADQNLEACITFAWRVWERLETDPEAYEAMCKLLEEQRAEDRED